MFDKLEDLLIRFDELLNTVSYTHLDVYKRQEQRRQVSLNLRKRVRQTRPRRSLSQRHPNTVPMKSC